MKAVIGYVRVSTEGQAEEGVSLAAQAAKIRQWAELHDCEVASLHEDAGLSGAKMSQRQGLHAAIDHACKSKGALVVYSLSRLARSTRDTLAISERLSKAGAELVSISEKIDTTSASGKMVFRLLAVLAEFERDQVSERTRVALHHMRTEGKRISRFAPYGHDLSPDRQELLPNPREEKVIVKIAKYSKGGRSSGWIAKKLTSQGIPTKLGREVWSAKVIRTILRRIEEEAA
jgi:site-specific DNA recombinase